MSELHVYDFDMTLYQSPISIIPSGWLYVRSLDGAGGPGFDLRWNMDILIKARRSAQSPWVHAILVTGRPDYREMRDKIESMLFNAGLDFEEVHLKPLSMNCSTPEYKAEVVSDFVDSDPAISQVVVYDDLEENHQAIAQAMALRGILYTGIIP